MTAKQEATTEKAKGKRGVKVCPICKKGCGVRLAKCKCGYEFPRKGISAGISSVSPAVLETMEFVERVGGIAEARRRLDEVAELATLFQSLNRKLD